MLKPSKSEALVPRQATAELAEERSLAERLKNHIATVTFKDLLGNSVHITDFEVHVAIAEIGANYLQQVVDRRRPMPETYSVAHAVPYGARGSE
jgi:hypothetical protein